jgi:uncharacterized protein YndB with AHSA1/START domain
MNRATFDPGPLAAVECSAADGRFTLVFVKELRHAPEAIWPALTDPEQLAQWAPYSADRDLGRPGDATLVMRDGDTVETFAATVVLAEPPRLLEYLWGDDRLRWELTRIDAGTRLTLRHTVQGEDWLPKVAAGWHLCLVVADQLLAGEPIGPIVGDEARRFGWDDLHDRYAARLGIAATGEPAG